MATLWKSYRGGPTKPVGEAVNISIGRANVISLNRRGYGLIDGAEAVKLLFDEKNGIIGIVQSIKRDPESFPVRKKNASTWVINAFPFCRHFNICLGRTERFDYPEVDAEGILRLDLNGTHNVSMRKNRDQSKLGEPNRHRALIGYRLNNKSGFG